MDTLKTLELYEDSIGYNKAGELLSDINKCYGIDIVRFGENISIILDRETLEHRSLLILYDQALEIYRRTFPMSVFEMLTFIYSATSEDYGETALEFDRMAVWNRCVNIEHCYAELLRAPDGWYKSCRDYFNLMSSKEYFQKRGNVAILDIRGKND